MSDPTDQKQELQDGAIPTGAPAGDEYVQVATQRRAHLCCGCCCDTRRASIVVDIITATFSALGLFSLVAVTSDGYQSQFDDDATIAALNDFNASGAVGWSMAFMAIGMIAGGVGIFGAYKFNQVCVMIAAVYHAVACIQGLIFLNLGGAIMSGFFAYPHFVFYKEMKAGIMTPVTYPNEQACCGC